jgi:hypothetical protein
MVRVVGRVEKKEEEKAIKSRKITRRKDREMDKIEREYKLRHLLRRPVVLYRTVCTLSTV